MHYFRYRKNELYCEGVRLSELARTFGTPLYIYSRRTLVEHYQKIKRAFSSLRPLICFSVKANSNLALLRVLAGQGAGMDVVSGGELFRALQIGVNPKKIVYAGVGKSKKEITQALKAGILFFNVESMPELVLIDRVAHHLRTRASVSLRLNPDVNPHTHSYITTGKMINKFGLDLATAENLFLRRQIFSNLNLIGAHIHIGSQITEHRPFVLAVKKVLPLINRLRKEGVGLRFFNIGGGLGIVYNKERPQTAAEFARAIIPWLRQAGLRIVLEPGRFIAGNSGILVTRVVYVKKTPQRNFAIVDAGMNDLLRPALYGAYHEVLPVLRPLAKKATRRPGNTQYSIRNTKYDIVGPICESGDFLAKNRPLPSLQPSQLLAVMSAGAYGFSMSSNYNSRPRAAEILVDRNRYSLVRKRETYHDLVRAELVG